MITPSRLAKSLTLVLLTYLFQPPASADSSCSATSSNGDKKCSITCPAGQSAVCSDSTGSTPPDCHCSGTQSRSNLSAPTKGQLAAPQALSPNGPSPLSPQFLWTEVPQATQYKVMVHVPAYDCPPPPPPMVGVNRARPGTGVIYADPTRVCSHGECGFRVNWDNVPFQGYPAGTSLGPERGGLPEIYCPRAADGSIVIFTWAVQARNLVSTSPESNQLSYSRAEAPPPPPAAPPLQSTYVVTCVFQTGPDYWGWYNGVFTSFVNSWGQVTPGVLGQTFTLSKPTFQNCSGLVNGAVPVDSAKFAVTSVSLCTNLVSGAQETFINLSCPTVSNSPTPYTPSITLKGH
jgi:hypothetical protein